MFYAPCAAGEYIQGQIMPVEYEFYESNIECTEGTTRLAIVGKVSYEVSVMSVLGLIGCVTTELHRIGWCDLLTNYIYPISSFISMLDYGLGKFRSTELMDFRGQTSENDTDD